MTPRKGGASEGLRERSGWWYGSWYDASGKRRERKLAKSKAEARRMRAEIVARVARARIGLEDPAELGGEVVLRSLLADWLRTKKARTTAKHIHDTERGALRMFRLMGAAVVRDLSASKLEDAMAALAGTGTSNRTVNREAGYVRGLIAWAEKRGRIMGAPRLFVDPLPTAGRHRRLVRRRLTDEECAALMAASEGDPIRTLFALALGTGMRQAEAMGSNWGDIDGSRILIPASRSKTSRARVAVMAPWLPEVIDEERARRKSLGPSDPIAVSSRGNRWSMPGAQKGLRRLIAAAGLDPQCPDGTRIDWHALRHTFATQLGAAGASEAVLQRQFGWTTGRMASVYVDHHRAPVEETMSRLGGKSVARSDSDDVSDDSERR